MKKHRWDKSTLPVMGQQGPLLELDLWDSSLGSAWWPGLSSWGLAGLSPKNKTMWSCPPLGSPPAGKRSGVRCSVGQAATRGNRGVLTPGFTNWLLEHRMSHLWWGRGWSQYGRSRGTYQIWLGSPLHAAPTLKPNSLGSTGLSFSGG